MCMWSPSPRPTYPLATYHLDALPLDPTQTLRNPPDGDAPFAIQTSVLHWTKSAWRSPKSQNFTRQRSCLGTYIRGSCVYTCRQWPVDLCWRIDSVWSKRPDQCRRKFKSKSGIKFKALIYCKVAVDLLNQPQHIYSASSLNVSSRTIVQCWKILKSLFKPHLCGFGILISGLCKGKQTVAQDYWHSLWYNYWNNCGLWR